MADQDWLQLARQWIAWDVNEGTRREVQALVDAQDVAALSAMFDARIAFGTAGLRAAMAPGPAAMNDLVVIQTTQGICKYLVEVFGEDEAKRRGVVLGYDHRAQGSLSSRRFAELAAAACLHAGFKVFLYRGVVATPLVPYCIEQKGCVAGVMVTASHNPKQDNGYKLYWANGAQIISPHDAQIARRILDDLAPWAGAGYDDPERVVYGHALLEDPTEDVPRAYFSQLRGSLCRFPEENRESALPIVYTAMHGVGHAFTSRSFEAFGLPAYVPTKEQLLPDPEFPTVAFPNPEEGKGALQLAMATAEAHGARLVLANDPDADRLAVAEMDPVTRRWKIFTGNEIGTLLGVWELEQHLRLHPDANRADLYFVASTVSSKALKAVAKAEGLRFEETLTGFKWMGNKTDELRNRDGKTVLLSFEEAIGFCIGDLVKDKDGVCAAAVVAEMAIWLDRHVNGQTLTQRLEELCTRYGHFVTRNGYIKVYDPATVAAIFERLRNGGQYWDACGEYAIESVRDLTTGFDSAQPGNKAVLPVSKSTQMITYTFANGCVATLRTSGTEPKLKFYVELAGRAGQPKADVEREADKQVREIVDRMLEPEKHGLAPPTL